jgi:hypothetical protein
MVGQANINIYQAVATEIPILYELIEAPVRGLQAQDYVPTQLESAVNHFRSRLSNSLSETSKITRLGQSTLMRTLATMQEAASGNWW